ncbi:Alpha/Beta hydrolase protein [Xylariales sp. PMI_506]|nr:Alpha/Beta hydrolase protein [Xylariales sp. PMI_506]
MQRKSTNIVQGWAVFIWAIVRTAAAVLVTSVTSLFPGSNKPPTYKKCLVYQGLKTFAQSTTPGLLSDTPTSKAYICWSHKVGLAVDIVQVGDTVGCWIGQRNADTVILYLHGGAYARSGVGAHFQLLNNLINQARQKERRLSAFVLQYGLIPEAVYPRQLEQTIAAFNYLTKDMGKSPSQVILAGDSAGGNLALAFLSHVMHPRPGLSPPAISIDSLKGLLLLSPWVTFSLDAPSIKSNFNKDYILTQRTKWCSDVFVGDTPEDNYTTPLNAPSKWWIDMPVDHVLVLGGGDEVMIDDIRNLGLKMQEFNRDKVEIFIGQRECHVSPVVELAFDFDTGHQTARLEKWIFGRL